MKPIKVRNLKTGAVIGTLVNFGTNDVGTRFVIVRPRSRALDLVIEMNENFNSNYEVKP